MIAVNNVEKKKVDWMPRSIEIGTATPVKEG